MAGPAPGGIVVVDKPAGWTSHDVVARLRRVFGTRRVGHAGTLDPMATGVLVVGVEWSTRLLAEITGVDKSYAATIRLGMSTTTDDAEGEPLATADTSAVTRDAVLAGITALTGDISQRPSSVSAIKVDGRRAYARVRAGEDVVLPERPVSVRSFTLDSLRPGDPHPPDPHPADPDPGGPGVGGRTLDVDVTVACSSGTYIRALARDLGAGLGVGGHLTALRRLSVGPWTLDDAVTLDELVGEPRLTPAAQAAGRVLPRLDLDAAAAAAFGQGRRSRLAGTSPLVPGRVAVLGPGGLLCGVGEIRDDRVGGNGPLLVPIAVAPPSVEPAPGRVGVADPAEVH